MMKRLATAGLLLCLTLKQKRYKMKEVNTSFTAWGKSHLLTKYP
ncbi:hypothetical protein [Lactococcus garvieae]